MFKNIIAPVQAWLLSQGRCVGCGKSLKKTKKGKTEITGEFKITCECGRIFIYQEKNKFYRRAKPDEV